jgi:DNA-binding transcriptional LysR family regulator
MDSVAHRVRRVATGWETELTVAVDGVMSQVTVFELCEAFFALCDHARADNMAPGTRLRLRTEVLAGTWEALSSGQADLAIGVATNMPTSPPPGVQVASLGSMDFVFAVAPHHPLASIKGPLSDADILKHRAVAVADSAKQLSPITVNLLPGQDVLTVSSTQAKVEAHLRCMGCGFLPEPVARRHIEAGHLVVKEVQRQRHTAEFGYAWRATSNQDASLGLGLQWWLQQLQSPATQKALLERHSSQWVC